MQVHILGLKIPLTKLLAKIAFCYGRHFFSLGHSLWKQPVEDPYYQVPYSYVEGRLLKAEDVQYNE